MSKKPISDDPVRRRVAAAMAAQGTDKATLSRAIGRNHAYMYQYLEAGKPADLPEDVRAILSEKLGIPESEMRGTRRAAAPRVPARPNARIGSAVDFGRASQATIPIFGQAVGGSNGRFIFNGQKIDDVLAPPALQNVRDAYAVYIDGTSMEPRYKAGETAYVHPHLPVRGGDFVVVQIMASHDGDPPDGYIKQFVSKDDVRLRLAQLNPRKTLSFPLAKVVSIHRIIMAG